MNDVDITQKLLDKFGPKKRTIGRYSVTDLYAIRAGWITKENFLLPEPPDFEAIKRMWNGIILHDLIEGMLERDKCEQKVVFPFKDINIVGKADYLPNESEVWDFKTSEKEMDKLKPWNAHQIKMYCSMFKRDVGKIYQPIVGQDKITLKFVGEVKRDDDWFMKELERIHSFHIRLVTHAYEKSSGQEVLGLKS